MYPLIIRSLVSLLIVALAALSLFGMLWWKAPPAPLAHDSGGGKFVLGALVVISVLGLWRLWKEPRVSSKS